jgi:hypothetical protein
MRDLGVAIFDSKALFQLKEDVRAWHGVAALLLSVFIFTLPTDLTSLAFQNWAYNFIVVGVEFAALLFIMWGIVVLFGRIPFVTFFSTVSMAFALSLLLVAVPAFVVSFFVFGVLLANQMLSQVLFSLIPYYNFLIFGWACETISETKSWRAISIALIALTAIFLFHYSLKFVTV